MGTPFSDIYVQFLSQVKIRNIANIFSNLNDAESPEDKEKAKVAIRNLEQNMQHWLISSLGHFGNCRKDLRKYDLNLECFLVDLDAEEINILAVYMAYAYMCTYVVADSSLQNNMNPKDYRIYSTANHNSSLIKIRDSLYAEANSLKSQYSYNIHSVKDFFKND